MSEFKERNDGFNGQLQRLEEQLSVIQAQENRRGEEMIGKDPQGAGTGADLSGGSQFRLGSHYFRQSGGQAEITKRKFHRYLFEAGPAV
ncbi:MAG: hypothetical protein ACLRQ4_17515 [Neglectibacter timonensis]